MKVYCTLIMLLLTSHFLFAQEGEDKNPDVAFAVIERVPIYPGCGGDDDTNEALKHCMSQKISALVSKTFNIKKASKGLEAGKHRVYVSFKIDNTGEITNIRTRGPSPALEKEAQRVVKKIPKMTPGQQKGENVGVLYSLPITFNLEDKKKKG